MLALDEGYCNVTRNCMRELELVGTCSLCRVISFPSYNVKSTGSMDEMKVFATPGGIFLLNLYSETRF